MGPRVNPGRRSWGFCVGDTNGDVIQAQAKEIEEPFSTNIQAEALAIRYALKYKKTTQTERLRQVL
ncbi:hypothetical protein KY285_026059 [Solanum tuberosum]|nr:hypothetical protein KY285_026059 [Solanum tuberosum]